MPMNELDYRGLAALDAVVDYGSFDKAAAALAITQSAVSQRLRMLENQRGERLIVRSQPPRATDAGQRLIAHYRQVRLLEAALARHPGQGDSRPEIAIAANADSAATWLQEAVAPVIASDACLLDIRLDDQDHTLDLLREGRVYGCVTSETSRVAGTTATALGAMRYLCVASPGFAQRWFADGFTAAAVTRAPALLFDRKDALLARYLLQRFGQPQAYPHHSLSSSDGFVRFAEAGLVYAMVPALQCAQALAAGRLVDLTPGDGLDVPLIWHRWDIETPLTRRLSDSLVDTARTWLQPDFSVPPPRL
jgi:LysR family transcriptional regulator (chromosome initiation inhibitor)